MSGYLVAVVGRSMQMLGERAAVSEGGFGVDSGIAGQAKIKACMDARLEPITRADAPAGAIPNPRHRQRHAACTSTTAAALTSARVRDTRTFPSMPWIKFEQRRT